MTLSIYDLTILKNQGTDFKNRFGLSGEVSK